MLEQQCRHFLVTSILDFATSIALTNRRARKELHLFHSTYSLPIEATGGEVGLILVLIGKLKIRNAIVVRRAIGLLNGVRKHVRRPQTLLTSRYKTGTGPHVPYSNVTVSK